MIEFNLTSENLFFEIDLLTAGYTYNGINGAGIYLAGEFGGGTVELTWQPKIGYDFVPVGFNGTSFIKPCTVNPAQSFPKFGILKFEIKNAINPNVLVGFYNTR